MANSAMGELIQKFASGEIDAEQLQAEAEALNANMVQPTQSKSNTGVLSTKLSNPDAYDDVSGSLGFKDETRTTEKKKILSTPMPKFVSPEDKRQQLAAWFEERASKPLPEDAQLGQLRDRAMQQDAKGNVIGSAFRGLGTIATSLGAPAVGNDIQQEWSRPNRLSWDTKQRAAELENFIAKKRGIMADAGKYADTEQDKLNTGAMKKYEADVRAFIPTVGEKTTQSVHTVNEASKEDKKRPLGSGIARPPRKTDYDKKREDAIASSKMKYLDGFIKLEDGHVPMTTPALDKYKERIGESENIVAGLKDIKAALEAYKKNPTFYNKNRQEAQSLANLATASMSVAQKQGALQKEEYINAMKGMGMDVNKMLSVDFWMDRFFNGKTDGISDAAVDANIKYFTRLPILYGKNSGYYFEPNKPEGAPANSGGKIMVKGPDGKVKEWTRTSEELKAFMDKNKGFQVVQ